MTVGLQSLNLFSDLSSGILSCPDAVSLPVPAGVMTAF